MSAQQCRLAAEQVSDPGDVEAQGIGAVEFDQGRPAAGPAGGGAEPGGFAGDIRRLGFQCRIERPGIGQPGAGRWAPRSAAAG